MMRVTYALLGALRQDLHPQESSGQKRFDRADPMMYPMRL